MNRGSDQVKEDPGDDSVVLRAYLHWASDAMARSTGAGWGCIGHPEDDVWLLLVNLPRGPAARPRRQHHFIPVDVGAELDKSHWQLVRLGPGVWDISPSVVVQGQLHAFLTLVDVPEPAPWLDR